jgi:hypothetical protein
VKTTRFSQVVAKSGKPEVYLTLIAPAKDRHLQSAIKAHKVMTLRQDNAGSKVDRGEIGFEEGPERQYLIFPRSLQRFTGQKVVGIKYDLITEPEISKSQLAPPAREKKKRHLKPARSKPVARALATALSSGGEESGHAPAGGERSDNRAGAVPMSHKQRQAAKPQIRRKREGTSKDIRQAAQRDEITAIKKLVLKAMSDLEKGKAVAAFNVLKQIADT